jgi:hypothetical protein
MDNNITINAAEIRKLPDHSIMDGEIIRQIALLGDSSLFDKVKQGFEVCGLYPFVIKSYNISPDKLK